MEQNINEAIVENKGGKRLKQGKGGKFWLIPLVLLVLTIAGYIGLGWYAQNLDTYWPNTVILGEDVSGKTAVEAAEHLASVLPDMGLFIYDMPEEGEGFSATMADDLTDAPPHTIVPFDQLGVTIDPNVLADDALAFQRDRNLLAAGKDYLRLRTGRMFRLYHGSATYTIDEKQMAQAAKTAAETLSFPAINTSYEVQENSLALTAPKDGRQVDEAALLEAIRSLSWAGDLSLKAKCADIPAKTLSAKAIHQEVAAEMKNAGYDAATDTITPEQMGADFDVSAAQKALDAAAPGETVTIPADIQRPEVTAEELKAVLFRDVLGETRTHVSGTAARISNVKLSAASINNYVMNTGDVFSYNEVVGKRTAENGYQAAPAYVKGETVDEIGGGICQTSSTLYYACLLGDLEITERYAHRYVPAYILWGADATVSWGGPDYKFTNNTPYPIKIVTEYNKGYLTVKVLGTNTTGQYAKVTNKVLETTPWETVYQEDETIAPGKEEVKTTPYTGYKVETYHTIYNKDGNVIDSHYEDTSNYKVRNKVILRAPGQLPSFPGEPVPPAVAPVTPAVPEDAPTFVPSEPDIPVDPPTYFDPEEESSFIIIPAFPDE